MYHSDHNSRRDQVVSETKITSETFHQESKAETRDEVTNQGSSFSGPGPIITTKLGLFFKVGTVFSLLALAACIGFITWIWWSDPKNRLWRYWVLIPNRVSLTCTVTGVVASAAISFLATLATAMIASVAIERRGVPLHTVAKASVARSGVSGPLTLFQLALERPVEAKVRALLVVLILTASATQLTSTLLTGDLQLQAIVSHPRQVPNAHNFIRRDHEKLVQGGLESFLAIDTTGAEHLAERPLTAPTFAEYSEPGVQLEGVDDTGPTVRAFLPISQKETRETLHRFDGMARVVESRVMCVRPDIVKLGLCDTAGEICGTVQLGSVDADAAGIGAATGPLHFRCAIPEFSNSWRLEQTWQFCRITRDPPIREPHDYDRENPDFGDWKLGSPLPGLSTEVLLVWNGFTSSRYNRKAKETTTVEKLRAEHVGPWLSTTYNVKNEYHRISNRTGDDVTFNMTLCLRSTGSMPRSYNLDDSQPVNFLNISALRLANLTEPIYGWDKLIGAFNTAGIRRQLGAVSEASSRGTSDRAVLSISRDSLMSSVDQAFTTYRNKSDSYSEGEWFWGMMGDEQVPTIGLCTRCSSKEGNPFWGMDQVYTQLFNHTLVETGSPALAVQAVMFMLARSVYGYYQNSYSDSGSSSTIDTFGMMLLPKSSLGYWAVMAIFVVFVLDFAAIAYLFRATGHSLPGNVWHTVSQISESRELQRVTREATVMSDVVVRRLVNETEQGKGLVEQMRSLLREFWSSLRTRDSDTVFAIRNGFFVLVSKGQPGVERGSEALETGRTSHSLNSTV